MQEPPTPITHPTAARSERFPRSNGMPAQGNGAGPSPKKPKLKKLRLAAVIGGLSILAVISTVFGMLMAVASDLPTLENRAQYESAKNSVLYADNFGCRDLDDTSKCQQIAKLTGNQNRILVGEGEISPNVKNAVIAIEDRRFYSHKGVDYAGIARAFGQDVLKRRAAQGGSTITQQFVKNALDAQADRSVFQKLREAALAYHLERQWSKEKILTQYLNTVYFGNGAYGIEAAVRTYFGDGDEPDERAGADDAGVSYTPPVVEEQQDPDAREAVDVAPHEAALLAGMIASPSMYDPIAHPEAAMARRNLVLQKMLDMNTITQGQYDKAIKQSLPAEDDVDPPNTESQQPYFTSWMTEHLLRLYRPGKVFAGGLKVRTTIDPELQQAAEQAIVGRLAGVGPDAALVAIKNGTGEVRAMVGGSDFNARPFNLATNGHRQPGSAFKPFILARALDDGVDPNSTWASQPKVFYSRNGRGQKVRFPVSNYEDSYLGSASLWSATATSDNSVFAELGMKVKPRRVATLAERMGIRTKLSTNPAMLLGGLKEGVTPLEMAYAYSTIANDGERISGSLAPDQTGPVAIQSVEEADGKVTENTPVKERVLPAKVAQVEKDMLGLVVSSGTGKAAQVGDEFIWGKTGTTENYGDAWFVGGNDDITVAIWVGYADRLQPMEYEHGGPVAGGTFPAEIFHDFMSSWLELRQQRRLERGANKRDNTTEGVAPAVPIAPSDLPPAEQAEPTEPDTGGEQDQGGGGGGQSQPAPQDPAPAPEPAPTPAPAPTEPPSDGGGGGVSPDAAG
jgi:penicillin-binding protein 1A